MFTAIECYFLTSSGFGINLCIGQTCLYFVLLVRLCILLCINASLLCLALPRPSHLRRAINGPSSIGLYGPLLARLVFSNEKAWPCLVTKTANIRCVSVVNRFFYSVSGLQI